MQKSVTVKKTEIPWASSRAEFASFGEKGGPPSTIYSRKSLMAFYTAKNASEALRALLSNGVSPVSPGQVREELKKSCEILPHMATRLLLAYRAKLEEYGMKPNEVALYMDSSGIRKPVPTIDLMFVVIDGGETEEKMKKLGSMIMNELVKGLRREMSLSCGVAGITNHFQIAGHDLRFNTVGSTCLPLGTL